MVLDCKTHHNYPTMKKTKKDQVSLFKLIFTLNWEDPVSDHTALRIGKEDKIFTITSGACNTLGFLLFDPQKIFAVDINPSQNYQLELKIAAIKALDYEVFIGFLGLTNLESRLEVFDALKTNMSVEAKEYWEENRNLIKRGFLINGRYEAFVKIISRMIMLIQGRKRVKGLFKCENLTEQMSFYDRYWEIRRTRFIFNLFFNKRILARRGLKADYFHFDDGSTSFAESFYRKFRHVCREVPIQGNYFIHLYLSGKYKNLTEVPDYLKESNFETIKARIDRIEIVSADAQGWISNLPSDSIDCFALSNICELMSDSDTERLFKQVLRTGKHGGRIIFRNLMIPREVPDHLSNQIKIDKELSEKLKNTDRSFVYSKVASYNIIKTIGENSN